MCYIWYQGVKVINLHRTFYPLLVYCSRQLPLAALRGGGPDRPEAQSGLVGVHHYGYSGTENGLSEAKTAVRPVKCQAAGVSIIQHQRLAVDFCS
jgi:hypothetical protein